MIFRASLFLVIVFSTLAGCATFHPETESNRIGVADGCTVDDETAKVGGFRPCTPLEDIHRRFDQVELGRTTFAALRSIGFGPPTSAIEIVPAPEICNRLTKTTDRCLELLDMEVRECVLHPKAAYVCRLAIFTNSYIRSVGTNNVMSRWIGIDKIDIVSAWSWEAAYVLEAPCANLNCAHAPEDEYIVVYKQLRPYEDPPTRKRRKLSIFDSSPVDLTVRP